MQVPLIAFLLCAVVSSVAMTDAEITGASTFDSFLSLCAIVSNAARTGAEIMGASTFHSFPSLCRCLE